MLKINLIKVTVVDFFLASKVQKHTTVFIIKEIHLCQSNTVYKFSKILENSLYFSVSYASLIFNNINQYYQKQLVI